MAPKFRLKPRAGTVKKLLRAADAQKTALERSQETVLAARTISRAAENSASIQEFFDKLVKLTRNRLGAAGVSFWYRDPRTGERKLVATHLSGQEGYTNDRLQEFRQRTIPKIEERANTSTESGTYQLFKSPEPVYYFKPQMLETGERVNNSVSLRLGNDYGLRLYGVFNDATELSDEQKRFLKDVAQFTAPAIKSLHEAWLSNLAAMRQKLALKPSEYRPYPAGLQALADEARSLFGNNAGITIAHKDKLAGHTEYRVRASAGVNGGTVDALNDYFRRTAKGKIDMDALRALLKNKHIEGVPFVSPQSDAHVLLLTGVKLSPYELNTFGSRVSEYLSALERHRADSTHYGGLTNSSYFRGELDRLIGKASAAKPFAAVYGDARHFKDVNDYLGHTMGDRIIKAIGHVLKRSAKDTLGKREDLEYSLGNMGGDEFAVAAHGNRSDIALRDFMERVKERSKRASKAMLRIVRSEMESNRDFRKNYLDRIRESVERERIAQITDAAVRSRAEEEGVNLEELKKNAPNEYAQYLRMLRETMESKVKAQVTQEEVEREAEKRLPQILSLAIDMGHVSTMRPMKVSEALDIAEKRMMANKLLAKTGEKPREQRSRW